MLVATTFNRKTGKMIKQEVLDNTEDPEVWDKLAEVFWKEIRQRKAEEKSA